MLTVRFQFTLNLQLLTTTTITITTERKTMNKKKWNEDAAGKVLLSIFTVVSR